MSDDSILRATVSRVIDSVTRQLPKWEVWFPNPESYVEVPRNELLALIHFAEIGLKYGTKDEPLPCGPVPTTVQSADQEV